MLIEKAFVRAGSSLTVPSAIDSDMNALSAWIYAVEGSGKDDCALVMFGENGILWNPGTETLCVVEMGQIVARTSRRSKWIHVCISATEPGGEIVYFLDGAQVFSSPEMTAHHLRDSALFLAWHPKFGSTTGLVFSVEAHASSLDASNALEKASSSPQYPCNAALEPPAISQPFSWEQFKQIEITPDWIERQQFFLKGSVARAYRPKRSTRVIHCHDMMGGYTEDKHAQGSSTHNVYAFAHWNLIDIFIYFSHHNISIPPPSWINAAHRNGVQVLATFITEWDAGYAICSDLLSSEASVEFYSQKLVDLAVVYNIDGWFINIENNIDRPKIPLLQKFLQVLTAKVHASIESGLVIWYDSVTERGDLIWQNTLNDSNELFFNACDGIFLNYRWNEAWARASAERASSRRGDVFFGIDVHGRGTFGGGGWSADSAMKVIAANGLSSAIFAPAWTFESVCGIDTDLASFFAAESRFWSGENRVDVITSKETGSLENWEVLVKGGDGFAESPDGWKKGERAVTTSHQWSKRRIRRAIPHEIAEEVATSRPPIIVKEYVKGTGPNTEDPFRLISQLELDSGHDISMQDSGVLKASSSWKRIEHIYAGYEGSPAVVSLEDAGRDAETWAGHYGAALSGATASIILRSAGGIQPYVHPHALPLPIVSNFCRGASTIMTVSGSVVSECPWGNLSLQSPLPVCLEKIRFDDGPQRLVTVSDTAAAFDGGYGLRIIGNFGGTESAAIPLYRILESGKCESLLSVSIVLRNDSPQEMDLALLVLCVDGSILSRPLVDAVQVAGGWKRFTVTVVAAESPIKLLSLHVSNPRSDNAFVSLAVGFLAVCRESPETAAVSNLCARAVWNPDRALGQNVTDIFASWDYSGEESALFDVYVAGSWRIRTAHNACFIRNIACTSSSDPVSVRVAPALVSSGNPQAASCEVHWSS